MEPEEKQALKKQHARAAEALVFSEINHEELPNYLLRPGFGKYLVTCTFNPALPLNPALLNAFFFGVQDKVAFDGVSQYEMGSTQLKFDAKVQGFFNGKKLNKPLQSLQKNTKKFQFIETAQGNATHTAGEPFFQLHTHQGTTHAFNPWEGIPTHIAEAGITSFRMLEPVRASAGIEHLQRAALHGGMALEAALEGATPRAAWQPKGERTIQPKSESKLIPIDANPANWALKNLINMQSTQITTPATAPAL